jgi:hypothetical protein
VPVPVGGVRGLCLEVHDLALSKWAAGREKDRVFVEEAVRHGLLNRATLLERLPTMPVDEDHRELLRARIEAAFSAR